MIPIMKKTFTIALLCSIVISCTKKSAQLEVEEKAPIDYYGHHTESIQKVFEAHGGFDNWTNLKQLSYEYAGGKTLVDLQNRYTRIESEGMTVGFDGQKVWVYPATENADRQRMRYNLMFYFYAFPFVVGDPGVIYEDLDPIEIKGEIYNAIKISYGDGIGDSPKDNYIILSDQETNQMEWLMYTATFGRGETSDRYSLIKYDGWAEHQGVILPGSLQWHQYKDGLAGDPRGGARVFSNIQVSGEYPAMTNFEAPEGASIAADPGE